MVRAAVDFLRGAWPFLDDFFPVDDEETELFLPDEDFAAEDPLLCFFFGVGEESWPSSPLPCSNSNAASVAAVNRLRILTGLSVTRLRVDAMPRSGCRFRFTHGQSNAVLRAYLTMTKRHQCASHRFSETKRRSDMRR